MEYENYTVSDRRSGYNNRRGGNRNLKRPPPPTFEPPQDAPQYPAAPTSSAQDSPRNSTRSLPYGKRNRGGRSSAPKSTPDTPTGIMVQPRLRYFPIFCSNLGVSELSRVMFQTILGRDARMAQAITQLQCEYVLTIAYINRLVQCGLELGYAYVPGASDLKTISKGIELPHTLVKYVESLGAFKLSSGVTVVPWVAPYGDMFNNADADQLMRSPADILIDAGRDVPDGDWPIDRQWILDWNMNTTRPSRLGFKFSKIGDSFDGRAEMVCSYGTVPGDDLRIQAYTPQLMTDAEAQLGACYRFRNIAESEQWLGGVPELTYFACIGSAFEPNVLLAEHTTRSLVQ